MWELVRRSHPGQSREQSRASREGGRGMRETPTVPVWGGCRVPCTHSGHCWSAHPINVCPGTQSSGLPGFQGLGAERCDPKWPTQTSAPSQASPGRDRGRSCQIPSLCPLGSDQSWRQEASRDTYRGLGFRGLGLLQSCFAGIQVKTPVLEEPPLLLRVENRKQ